MLKLTLDPNALKKNIALFTDEQLAEDIQRLKENIEAYPVQIADIATSVKSGDNTLMNVNFAQDEEEVKYRNVVFNVNAYYFIGDLFYCTDGTFTVAGEPFLQRSLELHLAEQKKRSAVLPGPGPRKVYARKN